MTDNPLVSVIVPAYNARAFIAATLDAVLAQTYTNLEVLVVDDGSIDHTVEIVDGFAKRDGRVRLIQQSNQGVAAARNTALKVAKGDYIAPVDADDIWFPSKIDKQVRAMHAAGPSTGLSYTWWTWIDEVGTPLFRCHPWTIDGRMADRLVALNFIGNASVPLFRRSCLEHVGGYEESFRKLGIQGCEDWDLALRVAEHYDVNVVPEYLAGYRRVRGSMSSNLATMIASHEHMLDRLVARRPNVPAILLRWSRGQLFGYTMMIGVRTGAYRAAAYWFLRGLGSRRVSYLSPWIIELAVAKLPRALACPLIRFIRALPQKWA